MFGGSRLTASLLLRFSGVGAWLLLGAIACGGGQKQPRALGLSAHDDPSEQLAAPPIETVQAPLTHVERAKVDEAVAEGVGRFIQGFDMVEELDQYDRFVGWKIGKIHDRSRFEGLGIGSGDVITSINGMPLERPAHAYEALMSLKTAESIDVEYLRGGRVMRLSLPIIGQPTKTRPASKSNDDNSKQPSDTGAAQPKAEAKSSDSSNKSAGNSQEKSDSKSDEKKKSED